MNGYSIDGAINFRFFSTSESMSFLVRKFIKQLSVNLITICPYFTSRKINLRIKSNYRVAVKFSSSRLFLQRKSLIVEKIKKCHEIEENIKQYILFSSTSFLFFTVIRLSHVGLWAIIEGTSSLTRC